MNTKKIIIPNSNFNPNPTRLKKQKNPTRKNKKIYTKKQKSLYTTLYIFYKFNYYSLWTGWHRRRTHQHQR
jgi:hypothetical protein